MIAGHEHARVETPHCRHRLPRKVTGLGLGDLVAAHEVPIGDPSPEPTTKLLAHGRDVAFGTWMRRSDQMFTRWRIATRDVRHHRHIVHRSITSAVQKQQWLNKRSLIGCEPVRCLLYTSDAADE